VDRFEAPESEALKAMGHVPSCARRRPPVLRIVRQDLNQARAQASEAMSLCQQLEDPRGIAWSLDVFAGLLAAGGDADGSARLRGASDGLLDTVGGSLVPSIGWIRDRYFEIVKTSLGPTSFESARARGARDGARTRDCARKSERASPLLNVPATFERAHEEQS